MKEVTHTRMVGVATKMMLVVLLRSSSPDCWSRPLPTKLLVAAHMVIALLHVIWKLNQEDDARSRILLSGLSQLKCYRTSIGDRGLAVCPLNNNSMAWITRLIVEVPQYGGHSVLVA